MNKKCKIILLIIVIILAISLYANIKLISNINIYTKSINGTYRNIDENISKYIVIKDNKIDYYKELGEIKEKELYNKYDHIYYIEDSETDCFVIKGTEKNKEVIYIINLDSESNIEVFEKISNESLYININKAK